MVPASRKPMVKIDLSKALLEDARRFPGCVMLLGCEICGWAKGYDVGRIINRLYELRDGGFQTPVADVARSVKRTCPRCKGKHWITQLAYPAHINEREAKRLANQHRN
jgi:hypothetical protein